MPAQPPPGPPESSRLYDALAPVYDAWQSANGMTPFALVALSKLEPALARQARGLSRRAGSFLDLGCGTGELLLGLARARPAWRLTGVDASAGMLAVAAGKPGARQIAWVRGRTDGTLPFAHSFDAAGAFYDTLNHLPDTEALARTFTAVAAVLRPGGALFFDLTNELGFELWWQGQNRWAGPRWRIAIQTEYDAPARSGTALVTVEDRDASASFTLAERWFTDDQVAAALGAAGLTVEKSEPWSPFDFDAPGKTWWTALKPTGS